MDWQILSYVAAAVVAAVGFYQSESVRSKNRSSAASDVSNAASDITNAAMKMLEVKNLENSKLRTELALYKLYVEYLLNGLRINGFVPRPIETFLE